MEVAAYQGVFRDLVDLSYRYKRLEQENKELQQEIERLLCYLDDLDAYRWES